MPYPVEFNKMYQNPFLDKFLKVKDLPLPILLINYMRRHIDVNDC